MREKTRFFLLSESGDRDYEEVKPNTRVKDFMDGSELVTIIPVKEGSSLKEEVGKILKGYGEDFRDGVYRFKVIDVRRVWDEGYKVYISTVTLRIFGNNNTFLDLNEEFYGDGTSRSEIHDLFWAVGLKADRGWKLADLVYTVGREGKCEIRCYELRTESGDRRYERRIDQFIMPDGLGSEAHK